METKLTLKLNKNVIDRAKLFASQNKTSLSKMIESYLDALTSESRRSSISPTVESLIGIVELPFGFNYKDEIPDFLSEKYK